MSRGQIFGVALIAGILIALLIPAFMNRHPTNSHGQIITHTEREILDHLTAIEGRLEKLEKKLVK